MQQDGLGPFRLCKGLWRGAWDKPALTGNECGRDGSNARGITPLASVWNATAMDTSGKGTSRSRIEATR